MTNGKLPPEKRAPNERLRAIWNRKHKELGLTQEKAGEYLGMSQGAVSHYLNSRKALSPWNTLRFARLLRVEPGEIQGTDDINLPIQVSSLSRRQQIILELMEWLDDGEQDELIHHLEAKKQDKLRTFEFVQKKGG